METSEEVPYATTVMVEKFEEGRNSPALPPLSTANGRARKRS